MSNSFSADFQGLAQIPSMINQVQSGLAAMKVMITTPNAAQATGSPVAGAAIIGLGVALGAFIVQTVDALADDIKGLTKNKERYEQADESVAASATAGTGTVNAVTQAPQVLLSNNISNSPVVVSSGSPNISGRPDAVAVA